MDAVKLVPKNDPYKDRAFVWVDPGSEAEKLWRDRDYMTEEEVEKSARPRMFRRETATEHPEPKAEAPALKAESGKASVPEIDRPARKP